jgi:hypothetical protein
MTQEQHHPDELHFDYKNPRIAEFDINDRTPEKEIMRILWTAMGVEEIVLSIKASGFFQFEPLYGINEGGKLVIIEGNRRLAAVKAILDPNLVNFSGVNKNALNVSDEIKESLISLPVVIVSNRQSAWKFIGFKHINGAQKWGSYAKAQYVSEIHNDYGVPLVEIASQLGDTFNTVEKLYQGLQVINQAEKKGIFDRTDIPANRLYFSHLYTGLQQSGFKSFLGIEDTPMDSKSPVAEEKLSDLGDLLNWVFGSKSKGIQSVIKSQNPDLRHLDAILRNPEARAALKQNIPLDAAFDITRPKASTFEEHIMSAKFSLQKAFAYLTEGYNGSNKDLLDQADAVANLSHDLHEQMSKIHTKFIGENSSRRR